MRFEDLPRVWREEGTGQYKRARIEDLAAAHGRARRHLHRWVRGGLLSLSVLLVITVPLFGLGAINAPRPILAWSGAILLWGWLAHPLAFWWRLGRTKPDPGLPVRDAVRAELGRLRMLEQFRQHSPWSLTAFVAGEICLFIGLGPDPREGMVTILSWSAIVLLIAALAVRGNRRQLERVDRPMREELESWASDLDRIGMDGDTNSGGVQ
jgi:hypothetical protein